MVLLCKVIIRKSTYYAGNIFFNFIVDFCYYFYFPVGQYGLRGQDGPQCLVLTIWLTCNVILFIETFWTYSTATEYHYLRYITGIGLSFSRASATIIMFNSSLLLLLVCRNTISAIKGIKSISLK